MGILNIKKYLFFFKFLVIALVICCVFEACLFAYNKITYKIYSDFHFIENEEFIIDNNVLYEEPNSFEGYTNLDLKSIPDIDIYNFKLVTNKKIPYETYVRVSTNYGDKLLAKANYEATEYTAYYKSGIKPNSIKIILQDNQLKKEDIECIIINSNYNNMPKYEFSLIRIILEIITIYLLILLIVYRKKLKELFNHFVYKYRIEKVFFVIVLLFGIIFTFMNTPLDQYDEHAHFWRSYEIAQGNLRIDKSISFPKSIINLFFDENGGYPNRHFDYEDIKQQLNVKLDKDNSNIFEIGSVEHYSVLNYMFVTIGTIIGSLLKLSPIIILYLGRLFNVLLYSILIYFAIKINPFGKCKKIIGVISIFPMTVNLIASYSPDTVILGFTFLAISYILRLKYDDSIKCITIKQILIFIILAIIPAICKIVYLFLFLLLFILPKNKLKHNKIIYVIGYFIILILLYYIFNVFLKGTTNYVTVEKNPIEQLIYCISNPFNAIIALLNSITKCGSLYIVQMVGGWNTWNIFSFILFIILLVINLDDNNIAQKKIENKDKIICLLISVIEILSVFAALYIDWSTAKSPYVIGIQGRYFLPILPLFMIGIEKNILNLKIRNKLSKFIVLICIIYAITIFYSIFKYNNLTLFLM